jgi:hypothetical protein
METKIFHDVKNIIFKKPSALIDEIAKDYDKKIVSYVP